jgi:hypothetical protein
MNHILRGRINLGATFLLAAAVIVMTAGTSQARLPDYIDKPNSLVAEYTWSESGWFVNNFDPEDSIYELADIEPSASDDGLDTTVIVPNFIDPLGLKKLRLIMTFKEDIDGSLVDISIEGHDPLETTAMQVHGTEFTSILQYFDWEIRPNPDWETIVIHGNVEAGIVPGNLDFVEVVSISIPEPGTALLAGFGLLAMCCRRRKRG